MDISGPENLLTADLLPKGEVALFFSIVKWFLCSRKDAPFSVSSDPVEGYQGRLRAITLS